MHYNRNRNWDTKRHINRKCGHNDYAIQKIMYPVTKQIDDTDMFSIMFVRFLVMMDMMQVQNTLYQKKEWESDYRVDEKTQGLCSFFDRLRQQME